MKLSDRTKTLYAHWSRITHGKKKANVCERWQDFVNFVQDVSDAPPGKVLSRPELETPWGPTNYCWAAPLTQRKEIRRLSDEDCDRIICLNSEGYYSQRKLAELYNVQVRTITRVLEKTENLRPKERKALYAEKITGWCTETPHTLTQLAKKLGVSVTTVRKIIETLPIHRFLISGTAMPYFYTTDANHAHSL